MKRAFIFLFVSTKAGFFLLAALIWSGVMCFVNYYNGITWKEIFVEADGMVFDLIIFGVVLTIYEAFRETKEKKERAFREKNEKIDRLQEEIDDYRGWDEKEATFRIVGTVKRLNKEAVSEINLSSCFLSGAKLSEVNLIGANLGFAMLEEADLFNSNLNGAILIHATLNNAHLNRANLQGTNLLFASLKETGLQGADLQGANLRGANLQGANLQGANLQDVNFVRANLQEANLERASVDADWFEKLEVWEVVGREKIKEKYQIDKNGDLKLKEQPSGVRPPILSYRQFKKQ